MSQLWLSKDVMVQIVPLDYQIGLVFYLKLPSTYQFIPFKSSQPYLNLLLIMNYRTSAWGAVRRREKKRKWILTLKKGCPNLMDINQCQSQQFSKELAQVLAEQCQNLRKLTINTCYYGGDHVITSKYLAWEKFSMLWSLEDLTINFKQPFNYSHGDYYFSLLHIISNFPLKSIPKLKRLSIQSQSDFYSQRDYEQLADKYPLLESFGSMKIVTEERLLGLRQLPYLKELKFYKASLWLNTEDIRMVTTALPNLTSLSFCSSGLRDEHIQVISEKILILQSLQIYQDKVTSKSLEHLMVYRTTLRKLQLCNQKENDEQTSTVQNMIPSELASFLKVMVALESLKISISYFSKEVSEVLSNLKLIKSLEIPRKVQYQVEYNEIVNSRCCYFSRLRGLNMLKLDRSTIGEVGTSKIIRNLDCSNLDLRHSENPNDQSFCRPGQKCDRNIRILQTNKQIKIQR